MYCSKTNWRRRPVCLEGWQLSSAHLSCCRLHRPLASPPPPQQQRWHASSRRNLTWAEAFAHLCLQSVQQKQQKQQQKQRTSSEAPTDARDSRERRGRCVSAKDLGVALAVAERASAWIATLALLSHAREVRLGPPDVVCYNSVLNSCGRVTRWRAGQALLRDMAERWAVHPDVVSYNVLLASHAKQARWHHGLALLDSMRQDHGRDDGFGVTSSNVPSPDAYSFNAAISACLNSRRWHQSLDLLDRVDRAVSNSDSATGTLRDSVTASLETAAWQASEDWEMALRSHFELLRSYGCEPFLTENDVGNIGKTGKTDAKAIQLRSILSSLVSATAAAANAKQWEQCLEVVRQSSHRSRLSTQCPAGKLDGSDILAACSAALSAAVHSRRRLCHQLLKRRPDQAQAAASHLTGKSGDSSTSESTNTSCFPGTSWNDGKDSLPWAAAADAVVLSSFALHEALLHNEGRVSGWNERARANLQEQFFAWASSGRAAPEASLVLGWAALDDLGGSSEGLDLQARRCFLQRSGRALLELGHSQRLGASATLPPMLSRSGARELLEGTSLSSPWAILQFSQQASNG